MFKYVKKICFYSFALILFSSSNAFAHDPFTGETKATINKNSVELEVRFAAVTAEGWVSRIYDRDNQVSEANLHNIEETLLAKAKSLYTLTSGNKALKFKSANVKIINHKDAVDFTLRYYGLDPNQELTILNNYVGAYDRGFRSTLTVVDDKNKQIALFVQTFETPSNKVSLMSAMKTSQIFMNFLYEGIVHIFIGFDHLLFLFALLLVCNTLRSAVLIISFFTVAHSITLALAALEIISISSPIVELFIAVTIVYVGLENLFTKHKPKLRWILTGVFGLIHGLGFANVLREIGFGAEESPNILILLAFNLGVEIGQIVIAMILLPLLWRLHKHSVFKSKVQPLLSVMVVLLGAFWVVSRL
ncbi:MAG: HupE/UreJ family protein [Colwellia sp.]